MIANTELATHTCAASGSEIITLSTAMIIGNHLVTYTDEDANRESDHSPALRVVIKDDVFTMLQQINYIKASNTDSNDQFGGATAISGNTLIIGATGEDSGGAGIFASPLTNNIISDSGAVYIYTRTGETWNNTAFIKTEISIVSQKFGYDLSLYGDTLVVSSPFDNSDTTGVYIDELSGSNGGAINSGTAYVFAKQGG